MNPHAFRRHPLKMVCLPVPPLPLLNNSFVYDALAGFAEGHARIVTLNVTLSVQVSQGEKLSSLSSIHTPRLTNESPFDEEMVVRPLGVFSGRDVSNVRLRALIEGAFSGLHDRHKRFRIQARPADQCTVDFFFCHQCSRVVRLYRSAVKNTHICGEFLPEGFRGLAAN